MPEFVIYNMEETSSYLKISYKEKHAFIQVDSLLRSSHNYLGGEPEILAAISLLIINIILCMDVVSAVC